MAEPFIINCKVQTYVDSDLYDTGNFGTDPTRPAYGGSAEHWLSYSNTMIAQARRDHPRADVIGHIKQEWSDGTVSEWDRYADVPHSPTA